MRRLYRSIHGMLSQRKWRIFISELREIMEPHYALNYIKEFMMIHSAGWFDIISFAQ